MNAQTNTDDSTVLCVPTTGEDDSNASSGRAVILDDSVDGNTSDNGGDGEYGYMDGDGASNIEDAPKTREDGNGTSNNLG